MTKIRQRDEKEKRWREKGRGVAWKDELKTSLEINIYTAQHPPVQTFGEKKIEPFVVKSSA